MAGFNEIEIKQRLRTCLVKNKKALFHRWIHIKNLIGQEYEVGLVEYENGQIEEVTPENIQFHDKIFKEYNFNFPKESK